MKLNNKINFVLAGLLVLAMAFLLASNAWAQATDNCNGHSCNDGGGGDVNVSVLTGATNMAVGGTTVSDDSISNLNFDSKALALANGLGDVDIRDCLGSTQWGTPIYSKQKLVLNNVCMAEFYLKAGKWSLAAMALCNQPEILTEFETEAACELAHDFGPVLVVIPDEITETFEDEQQIQDHEISVVQMAQTEIYERIEALEKKPAPRPRVVQGPPPDPYSEAQISAVWAALGKGGEDEDER